MSEIPNQLKIALLDFGLTERQIKKVTLQTRVLHDLGIYGDDFDMLYSCISKHSGGTGLVPAEFIPAEFSRSAQFYWLWRCLRWKFLAPSAPSLTLGELMDFICSNSAPTAEKTE